MGCRLKAAGQREKRNEAIGHGKLCKKNES